jgi:hypothetical protein
MKIDMHAVEESTIENFAEKYSLRMQIYERSNKSLPKYFAYFYGAEISDGKFLHGVSGDGNTPQEAIANYASNISEKILTFDAHTEKRREICVPRIISSKIL